jgi:peptide-methionine (S)-S-oxide reductase
MRRSLPSLVAVLAVFTIAFVLFAAKLTNGASRSTDEPVSPPSFDAQVTGGATEDTAVFAGGCFWGVEAVYDHVKGVKRAISGYAGGDVASPSYDQVSTGDTGHAESVEVIYDPSQVSYGKLLQIFFSVAHDPTQLDRQGPDRGTSTAQPSSTGTPSSSRLPRATSSS